MAGVDVCLLGAFVAHLQEMQRLRLLIRVDVKPERQPRVAWTILIQGKQSFPFGPNERGLVRPPTKLKMFEERLEIHQAVPELHTIRLRELFHSLFQRRMLSPCNWRPDPLAHGVDSAGPTKTSRSAQLFPSGIFTSIPIRPHRRIHCFFQNFRVTLAYKPSQNIPRATGATRSQSLSKSPLPTEA